MQSLSNPSQSKRISLWPSMLVLTLSLFLISSFSSTAYAQNSNYTIIDPPGISNFSGGATNEFSSIAYSGTTGTLFIVDDGATSVYEFTMGGAYIRSINIGGMITGLADLEAIGWMYDNRFAVGNEQDGKIYVFDIPAGSNSINSALYTVNTGIAENSGFGLEGVAYDQNSSATDRFYVIDQRDGAGTPRIHHFTQSGALLSSFAIPVNILAYGSDIYHSASEQALFVVGNDENNSANSKVLKLSMSGTVLWSQSASAFGKPEGITFKPDMSEMIVTGEPRQYARYAINDPNAPQTLEVGVNASSDDAEQNMGDNGVSRSSGDLDLGYDDGQIFKTGIIFRNVNIPQGAQITSAKIEFRGDEANAGSMTITLKGLAQSNAPTFSPTTNNISSRPTTAATVTWSNVPNFVNGGIYLTPNLSTLVQEIMNVSGWATGNAVGFVVDGTDQRAADSYDGGFPPKLIVTYTMGDPGGNQLPEISGPLTDQSSIVGAFDSYDINATDADAEDTLTFSVSGQPAGMNINASTGLISGTPTTAGTYNVTVSVSDGDGGSDSESFTWSVAAEPGGDWSCTIIGTRTNLNGPTLNDYSGITLNEERGSFFVVNNNGDQIVEYSLATNSYVRTISTSIPAMDDIEGISWMYGNRYAIAAEQNGVIYVIDIVPGQTSVTSAVYSISTGIAEIGGSGMEGIAFDHSTEGRGNDMFYVLREKNSPSIYKFAQASGQVGNPINIGNHVSDAAGIYYAAGEGSIFVVSHESTKVVKLNTSGELIDEMSVSGFGQAEGIGFASDGTTMYVVGEPKQFARYSCPAFDIPNRAPVLDAVADQTAVVDEPTSYTISATDADGDALIYALSGQPDGMDIDFETGLISGTPTTAGTYNTTVAVTDGTETDSATFTWTVEDAPEVLMGDVSCDGSMNIVDALFVAQYVVGNRAPLDSCPLEDPASQINVAVGDVNDDDSISIVDALFIAQCEVGIGNIFCPGAVNRTQTTTFAPTGPVALQARLTDNAIVLTAEDGGRVSAATFEVDYDASMASFVGCTAIDNDSATVVCSEENNGVIEVAYLAPQGANSVHMAIQLQFESASSSGVTLDNVAIVDIVDGGGDSISAEFVNPASLIFLPFTSR